MPKLSNSSVGQISEMNKLLYPLREKIGQFEIKILEYETRINILKKNIEKIDELNEKVNSIISYTDKSRLTGTIKDVNNIKKQINLTKKSKILSAITQIKTRLTQCENSFITSDEDEEESKK